MSSVSPLLEVQGLSKRFCRLWALLDVDLELQAGEVHGLLGGNGAGKSTLIKVLSGVHRADAGSIRLLGARMRGHGPRAAKSLGIATIHQEIDLVPTLSLAENLLLGEQPRGVFGISRKRLLAEATAALAVLGVECDVGMPAGESSAALRQLVCIARALRHEAKVLILDEPTSSLDRREVERVFAAVRKVVASGAAALFVTHFLDQVYALCDRVTVLRDGRRVATTPIGDLPRAMLVEQMLGKLPATVAVARSEKSSATAPLFTARGVGRRRAIEPFDLDVRPGEVVGLAGLLGAGRSELVRTLFGAEPSDSGHFAKRGVSVRIASPRDAVLQGLAFCPEDRRSEGLFPSLSVAENLCALTRLGGSFWLSERDTRQATRFVTELGIKVGSLRDPVRTLSGGNQQKVILGRWLATAPALLILDEPTRGIDVGAKAEIERWIGTAREQGMAVIFVSSELDEVVRVSDRVLVLADRRVVAELPRGVASEASIVAAIASHEASHEAPSEAPHEAVP